MPGPYEIYGDYESERTVSSALPFGLGGTGVMGWAPELAMWGVGSLVFRYGIKTGLVGSATADEVGKLRYSKYQEKVASRVARAGARGGDPAAVRFRMARAMQKAQFKHMGGEAFEDIRPQPFKNGRLRYRRKFMNREGIKVKFRGEKVVQQTAATVSRSTNLWNNSYKGARIAQIGQNLKGWGVAIGSAQLAAFAMDIGASIGHAAIDWRPRKEGKTAYEFGGNYTETGEAYTQRQRAIMAIHDSQLTSRAAIGGEAAFMHM